MVPGSFLIRHHQTQAYFLTRNVFLNIWSKIVRETGCATARSLPVYTQRHEQKSICCSNSALTTIKQRLIEATADWWSAPRLSCCFAASVVMATKVRIMCVFTVLKIPCSRISSRLFFLGHDLFGIRHRCTFTFAFNDFTIGAKRRISGLWIAPTFRPLRPPPRPRFHLVSGNVRTGFGFTFWPPKKLTFLSSDFDNHSVRNVGGGEEL